MAASRPQKPIDLARLSQQQFRRIIRSVLTDTNLGAGVDVSGVSGSGKSNFSEWAIHEAAEMGIPFIHIDPHGTSARKVWKMCLTLPPRLRQNIVYWRVADPHHLAAINPLWHDPFEDQLSNYERLARGRIQVELTANIILSAVGEGGSGFAHRPVMRKWITRWLWMLWNAGLTLADALMLIDPHHPVYQQLVQLAPDAMSRQQLEALPGLRVSELEAEVGSARNRIANILEHPAAELLLSRRHQTMDFQQIYQRGTSLIIDLDRGEILSEEVQRLICNVILNQFLAVVLSTPEAKRRRWLTIIDELPVFNESCGPLLERLCTEIRKYKNSFVFLHQGGARFPGRTENEFLQTIIDMCRVKILFRHNVDVEFFGKLVALAAHGEARIKHVQTTPQQFTVGHEVVELMDRGEGTSEMSGQTVTDGTTHQSGNSTSVTDSLANAVSEADRQTQTRSKGETTGRSSSLSKSQAHARQNTSTRTTNLTFKQTLIPQIVTRNVVTSLQFHTKEEIEWAAAAKLKNLNTGEAVLMIDGKGVWEVLTPKANDPYAHAPKFAARKLIEWRQQLVQRPEFASPEQILTERQRFLEQLTAELGQLSQRPDAKRISLSESIPQSAPPLLIHPTDDDADPRVTL